MIVETTSLTITWSAMTEAERNHLVHEKLVRTPRHWQATMDINEQWHCADCSFVGDLFEMEHHMRVPRYTVDMSEAWQLLLSLPTARSQACVESLMKELNWPAQLSAEKLCKIMLANAGILIKE